MFWMFHEFLKEKGKFNNWLGEEGSNGSKFNQCGQNINKANCFVPNRYQSDFGNPQRSLPILLNLLAIISIYLAGMCFSKS